MEPKFWSMEKSVLLRRMCRLESGMGILSNVSRMEKVVGLVVAKILDRGAMVEPAISIRRRNALISSVSLTDGRECERLRVRPGWQGGGEAGRTMIFGRAPLLGDATPAPPLSSSLSRAVLHMAIAVFESMALSLAPRRFSWQRMTSRSSVTNSPDAWLSRSVSFAMGVTLTWAMILCRTPRTPSSQICWKSRWVDLKVPERTGLSCGLRQQKMHTFQCQITGAAFVAQHVHVWVQLSQAQSPVLYALSFSLQTNKMATLGLRHTLHPSKRTNALRFSQRRSLIWWRCPCRSFQSRSHCRSYHHCASSSSSFAFLFPFRWNRESFRLCIFPVKITKTCALPIYNINRTTQTERKKLWRDWLRFNPLHDTQRRQTDGLYGNVASAWRNEMPVVEARFAHANDLYACPLTISPS